MHQLIVISSCQQKRHSTFYREEVLVIMSDCSSKEGEKTKTVISIFNKHKTNELHVHGNSTDIKH